VEDAGGKSLAHMVDIRDEAAVAKSIEDTVKHFGGIDILINNASAISLTGTEVNTFLRCHQIIIVRVVSLSH
jgi:citronellol/citronellal dehydrogenase